MSLNPAGASWALLGLASGHQPFSDRCLGLLELSRTRARDAGTTRRPGAAPERRAPIVRQLPRELRQALERDAALVRTGLSATSA